MTILVVQLNFHKTCKMPYSLDQGSTQCLCKNTVREWANQAISENLHGQITEKKKEIKKELDKLEH